MVDIPKDSKILIQINALELNRAIERAIDRAANEGANLAMRIFKESEKKTKSEIAKALKSNSDE